MAAKRNMMMFSETSAEPLRRADLLRLSAELFSRKGYADATINDIAESANLSKATFYHYFTSKQAVYDEIVLDCLTRLISTVKAIVARRRSARKKLEAAVEAHAEFFEANFWTFTAMMAGPGGLSEAPRAQVFALRREYSEIYRDIIAAGMETDEFGPCDPRLAARGLLSMLYWMSRWFDPGGERPAIDFAREYLALVMLGLIRR